MTTVTFNKGTGQTWVVPFGVGSITIDAYGAQGNKGDDTYASGGAGANGAHAKGTASVTPGTVLYITVGGQDGTGQGGAGGTGNGAGNGGSGGGMTFVCLTSGTFSQANAIIVAAGGGGGGAGASTGQNGGSGGQGGYTSGSNGTDGSGGLHGTGATTAAVGSGGATGGVNGNVNGTGGVGANGQAGGVPRSGGGGGGGGGYNGAGGGGSSTDNSAGGGGGGASFFNASLTSTSGSAGAQTGDGLLTITYSSNLSTIFDTETVSENVSIEIVIAPINVHDVDNTILDVPTLSIESSVVSPTNASITTSSYKWLTQTLFNTQNQPTVRPYISAQIIDNTLLVNQQLVNTSSWSGDAVTAPDGSILAIGSDTINDDLVFARITDGTQISQWDNILNDTGTIIAYHPASANSPKWMIANPNFSANTFHLNASIAVSDWINGSYTIDIYFWWNDISNSAFNIYHARSNDMGITWSYTITANTSIPDGVGVQFFPFWLAAGKPIYNPITKNTSAAAFYCVQLAGQTETTIYQTYSIDGSYSGSSWQSWSSSNWANSGDWLMHSFDVEYINGIYYIIFAGYRSLLENTNSSSAPTLSSSSIQNQFFGNYGLYLMRFMQLNDNGTGVQLGTGLIWDEPREILTFNSNSQQNLNQCLYPALNYDGTYLWLTFRGDFTNSVSEANVIGTQTNYYLSRSANFENFDYPTMVLDSSGNTPNQYSSNGVCRYSFIGNQNGYYYFWGDGALWQFIQNGVVADVSNDILSYQVQDQSGGASSINLTISNANGKWAGPSPSGIGYQAIWKNGSANKNSQIYLRQGYYTTNGAETVPRNIFYIDDITQNISASTNDLVITGRDFNKLLSVTQTRWTYTFQGQDLYFDPFNTTSIANWNTQLGTWQRTQPTSPPSGTTLNFFSPYTSYVYNPSSGTPYTTALTGPTLAILSGYSIKRPTMSMCVIASLPISTTSGAEIDVYPFYINSNNYIKVSITGDGAHTNLATTLVTNGSSSSVTGITGSQVQTTILTQAYYPVYITSYDYFQTIDVMVGEGVSNFGNHMFEFFAPILFATYSLPSTPYQYAGGQLPSIAIGTAGNFGTDGSAQATLTQWTSFSNLRFVNYTYSQDIEELTKQLGTKAHIFNYLGEDTVQDLYDITQWQSSGTFSVKNRRVNLSSQSFILQNTQQYSDGRISFDAQISASSGDNFGFDFIFRSQSRSNLNNCYKLRFMNSQNYTSGTNIVKCSLLISLGSIAPHSYLDDLLFSSILPDNLTSQVGSTGKGYIGSNNLEIDLTQSNHYDIVFNKGWIYAFVNKIMVFAWYDNNYKTTYSIGYWGFSTVNAGNGASGTQTLDYAFSSDEILYVQNITFPTFWQYISTFTLNPGDDLTSAITKNLQSVYGWMFSDLGGRMKLITLNSTDPVSYYYGNGAINYLLYNTSNDSSDKEYFNQVLVVGDGVSYLATDNSNVGSNGILREEVIVDYTITTVADAQTRATQELANVEKYGAQPAPTQIIQVGSELFDVVNIQDNAVGNSSNLNGNYRIYVQTFNVDNQSNYNIVLGTGSITS